MTCYDRALKLLALREHSRKELENKLRQKGCSADDILMALDRLEEENFLSDRRFCESYIRSRLRKSPEGQQILILRLKEKGVSSALASACVSQYFAEHEEEIDSLFKRFKERVIEKKGEEKAMAFLYRKGIRTED